MLDVKDLCFRKALYSTLTCIRACKTLYYQSSRTLTYNYVNVSCIRFTLDDKRCTAAHLLVYSIHANKFLIIDFNTMLWMNFIQLIILYDQLHDLNGSTIWFEWISFLCGCNSVAAGSCICMIPAPWTVVCVHSAH